VLFTLAVGPSVNDNAADGQHIIHSSREWEKRMMEQIDVVTYMGLA
jgi:hypothetical protein